MIINHALSLASKGFYIFPIVPNTKIPPKGFHFKEEATRDLTKIKHWWTNGYSNHNIGIFTEKFRESEALLVIDVDQKEGNVGENELIKLELEGLDFPVTAEQRTPSGGRHLIYKTREPVRNSVQKLGRGLDIRSQGGYIVGPGSVLSNGCYVLGDGEVCEAPERLVSRLRRPSTKSNDRTKQRTYNVSPENAVSRAKHYLEALAPIAIEGAGGDQTTFSVAAKVKDFGVNEQECFELMSELWNERCSPPWQLEELGVKISNAYQYSENPIGIDSPEAEFEKIEIPEGEQPKQKPSALQWRPFVTISPNFDETYLVEKLIGPGAMSVVYGDSNTGKTFVCLDAALHISLGREWMGKKVKQGLVIYVAAEGGVGIEKRIDGFRKYHKLEKVNVPFCLIPSAINLLNPKTHVKELIDIVKEVELEFKQKTQLIVVDTLARAISGGNENSSEDMGAFVTNIDSIRQSTKSHVMVIHHSGKDTAKGARGHSSLKAATDTEIEVANCTVRVTKQRDMDFTKPFGFKLEQIEIGRNSLAEAVTSCVVLPAHNSSIQDFSKTEPGTDTLGGRSLKALRNVLDWSPIPAPNDLDLPDGKMVAEIEEWREEFFKLAYPDGEKKRARYNAFIRSITLLSGSNIIGRSDKFAWTI